MLRCERCASAWLFELAGGAIADSEGTCIPKAQREAAFTIAALHQWEMGVDDPRCVSSAEDVRCSPPTPECPANYDFPFPFLSCVSQWLRETMKPVACGGAFPSVSFLPMTQIQRILMCSGTTCSSLDGTRSPRA